MSWGEILFWVWLVGWPVSVLPIARTILRIPDEGWDEHFDLVFAACLAVVAGMFWPLALAAVFVYARLATEVHERDKRS